MTYAPEYFPAPEFYTSFSGFVVYTANGQFPENSPSYSVLMVL